MYCNGLRMFIELHGILRNRAQLDLESNWHINASAGSIPARGTLNPCSSIFYRIAGFFCFRAGSGATFHLCSLDDPRSGQTHRSSKRSEEHTSELQSRGHLVCRLLLEKKKNRV